MNLFYIFLKNLLNLLIDKNKKIKFNKLQVWVGDVCSLKCKHCSQLFPYLKEHKFYDIDKQIEYLDKILSVCEVDSLHIIGGEPFTNKNIYKLIEYIATNNSGKKNKIVSNGTIIPDEKTTEYLKKYRNDIFTTISHYDCAKEQQNKVIQHFEKNEIPYVIINEDIAHWFFMGTDKQEKLTDKQLIEQNFANCWDKSCYTLADGELSICPRMHNSFKIFKHKKPFFEYIKASSIKNNLIGKALLLTVFDSTYPREACLY